MIWITLRLKKPGVSGKIRREIRSRYIEYMMLYVSFSWPICYMTKPSYRFYASLNAFVGGTEWITGQRAIFVPVLLSGVILSLSRLRDRLTL